jgi:hypothetical protein
MSDDEIQRHNEYRIRVAERMYELVEFRTFEELTGNEFDRGVLKVLESRYKNG